MFESLRSRTCLGLVGLALSVACSKPGPSTNPTVDGGLHDDGGHDAGLLDAGCVDASGGGRVDGGPAAVLAWLQETCGWEKTSLADDRAIYREASAAQLARVPPLEWTGCGAGCESATVAFGASGTFAAFSSVQNGQTQSAFLAVTHPVPLVGGGYVSVRRIISLNDGATVNVLSARYAQRVLNSLVGLSDDESAFKIFVSESAGSFRGLDAAFDLSTRRWDFKQPWYDSSVSSRYSWCFNGVVSASPPGVVFLCSDQVELMSAPGSRELTVVPDSASTISAGVDNGLATWAQPADAGTMRSRIRSLKPGSVDAGDVAVLDGSVCGLGSRDDQTIGFRGETPDWCSSFVSNKRFFRLSPDGGVVNGPLIGGDSLAVTRISAGRDYAAAYGVWQSPDAGEKREFVILIRLSDWKLKRFWAPPGWRLASQGIVVDDSYLYFATLFAQGNESGEIDSLYRFDLNRFDEIGEAFE